MTEREASSAAFFERKYSGACDPWNFAGSAYELERYAAIVAALQHRRWQNAFEPGCSIGVLTERLAGLCERVTAVDFAESAVEQTRVRCARWPAVRVECASLAERADVAGYDLIVLSEIGYYFEAEAWRELAGRMVGSMEMGATLLGAHWLGSSADHCLHGDAVHAVLRADDRLVLQHAERHTGFRLDRWERR